MMNICFFCKYYLSGVNNCDIKDHPRCAKTGKYTKLNNQCEHFATDAQQYIKFTDDYE